MLYYEQSLTAHFALLVTLHSKQMWDSCDVILSSSSGGHVEATWEACAGISYCHELKFSLSLSANGLPFTLQALDPGHVDCMHVENTWGRQRTLKSMVTFTSRYLQVSFESLH